MQNEIELGRLYESYQQAVAACNIEQIAHQGQLYFSVLRDGKPTEEDIEIMQNEMLEAKAWCSKPL